MKRTVIFSMNGQQTRFQGVSDAKKGINQMISKLSVQEQKTITLFIKRNQLFFKTCSSECMIEG
jgi:hypothetical protein